MQVVQLDGRIIDCEGTIPEMLALGGAQLEAGARSIRAFRLNPGVRFRRARRKVRNKISSRSRRRNRK